MKKGFSVIEILIVIGVFAVIGVLATQSVNLTIKSSKKSDSITFVKQELDFASENIERLLQTAGSVMVPGCSSALNVATKSVGFRTSTGLRGDVACIDFVSGLYTLSDPRVATSSGEEISYKQRLTTQDLAITNCNFVCSDQNSETVIDFTISARAKNVTDMSENLQVETSRKILVRKSKRR